MEHQGNNVWNIKRIKGVTIMSERKITLAKIQKVIARNNGEINATHVNAVMAEVNINTYKKHIIELDRLHKIKINNVQKQVNRYIESAKNMHDRMDTLLKEKEALHLELKEAIHYGEVQCEWCLNYFTSQGISRHKTACISKPSNKAVEEDKEEIKGIKDDIAARRAMLQKELDELKKIEK